MLKNILNLGSILKKIEQKSIKGGNSSVSCPSGYCVNLSGGCTHLASAIFDDCA